MRLKYILILFLIAIISGAIFVLKKDSTDNKLGCKGCNVILISVDTLSSKHLGLYGYQRPTSPFLDKVASERGLVFENAIVQASWTFPSHTAMLTSKYPAELGIWEPFDKLPDEAKTIAEVLKENGYGTQAFSNGFFVQPEWGFDQGFEGFSGSLDPKNFHDAPKIFQDALSWIESNNNSQFFVFMRPWNLNSIGKPVNEALAAIGQNAETWQAVTGDETIAANIRPGGATEEELERFRLEYDAKIREVDSGFEELINGLDRLKILDKTIVIFTADHGEEFGEHGTARFHTSLYDETISVPLIVLIPKVGAGRVDDVVEIRSIPKMITGLIGINGTAFEGNMVGEYFGQSSPVVIAKSTTALDRDWFFKLDLSNKTNLEKIRPQILSVGKSTFPKLRTDEFSGSYSSSARSDKWHLLKDTKDNFELYNLETDPTEAQNLFPKWEQLNSEDRREALKVIQVLGTEVPVPCGIYCTDENSED